MISKPKESRKIIQTIFSVELGQSATEPKKYLSIWKLVLQTKLKLFFKFLKDFLWRFLTMRPEERQISEAHRNCSKTVRRQYKEIVLNLPENARITLKFDPKFSNLKPEKWVQSCPNFENGFLRRSPRKSTWFDKNVSKLKDSLKIMSNKRC